MNLREWLAYADAELRSVDVKSPSLEAQVLAAHVLRVDRSWLFAHPEAEFNDLAGESLLERRRNGEPLAYIIGHKEFFGRDFAVDPSVLVPRQETEILVEQALELFPSEGDLVSPANLEVLDMGTGSGILAISLKLERPSWRVTGVDISAEALATASANARFHRASVRWLLSDGFNALLGESFDLIVSNPPYIGRSEDLPLEIRGFEPESALFAENGGAAFYEMLASQAAKYLTEHGVILVEVGYSQSEQVKEIFVKEGWTSISEAKDLSGVPRVLGFRHEFECLI